MCVEEEEVYRKSPIYSENQSLTKILRTLSTIRTHTHTGLLYFFIKRIINITKLFRTGRLATSLVKTEQASATGPRCLGHLDFEI